jgi:hypothetical protein
MIRNTYKSINSFQLTKGDEARNSFALDKMAEAGDIVNEVWDATDGKANTNLGKIAHRNATCVCVSFNVVSCTRPFSRIPSSGFRAGFSLDIPRTYKRKATG